MLAKTSKRMTDWNPDNPADLGVWEELEWTQPLPAKKKSLSLTLKKRCRKSPDPERFHSPGKVWISIKSSIFQRILKSIRVGGQEFRSLDG